MENEEATHLLLRQAWQALGGAPELLDDVQIVGDPGGLLPSTLAVLPAMTAAVAVSTLAAAVLDCSRGSTSWAPVVIDQEHVAVAARSERAGPVPARRPCDRRRADHPPGQTEFGRVGL